MATPKRLEDVVQGDGEEKSAGIVSLGQSDNKYGFPGWQQLLQTSSDFTNPRCPKLGLPVLVPRFPILKLKINFSVKN